MNANRNKAFARHDPAADRAKDFVERMSRAFSGLTEEELLLVNGVYLTEPRRAQRTSKAVTAGSPRGSDTP